MRNKVLIIGLMALCLIFVILAVWWLGYKQVSGAEQLLGWFKKFTSPNTNSTDAQIVVLQQQIDDLKRQQAQSNEKVNLTPASPSPAPNLKTQEELNRAKQTIGSLQQQLQQLQTQGSPSATPLSDANLIKSWQASERVVQIACQNNLLNTWQLGSGVLISEDGKILTNLHVVQLTMGNFPDYCLALFSKDYNSQTQGYQREYRATITGFFNGRDAAQLKIQDVVYRDQNGQIQTAPIVSPFQFFRPASGAPQIGDAAYVIGFPESASFNFSVTKGIISNLTSDNYFGTDAQIDRGNSGGAAVNSQGQLIGLPTYKFISGGDYRGYILDINSLKLD